MEFKGTKGKWQIQPRSKEGSMIASFNPKRSDICEVFYYASDDIEAQANALLISKAPEMLEMLKKVSVMCEHLKIAHVKNEIDKLIKQATEI